MAGTSAALTPAVDAATSPPPAAHTRHAAGTASAAPADDSSVTQTHDWQDDQGTSRSGTVTVSQTKDLATRQIVNISWSGFMPTTNSFIPDRPSTPRRRHRSPRAIRLCSWSARETTPRR